MLDVTTYDSMDSLPPEFIAAASFAGRGEIFQSIEWFRCLHQTVFKAIADPRFFAVRDGGGLVGFAACNLPSGRRELRSLTNYYAIEYRPVYLGDPGDSDGRKLFLERLARHISSERPRWPYVRLDSLRSDWSDAEHLTTALRKEGFLVRRTRQHENWYLEVGDADFEAYYARRSSQLRNTIARKEKKARKSHDLQIRIFTRNDAELSAAIDAYVRIYNSSWKVPEPFPQFIPAFMRLCADLSILRLGVAYLDDKPVAAQLWIRSGERAIIYKLAYDEAIAELSIGSILSRELFRHAIDVDRVQEIDYGFGSETYKREWMSGVRYLDCLEAYRLASFRGVARVTMDAATALIRRVRSSG